MNFQEKKLSVDCNHELHLLKKAIGKKRIELMKVINEGNEYLTDKKIVQLSQQLDSLLVRYIKYNVV